MRAFALVFVVVGCGGPQQPPPPPQSDGSATPPPAFHDSRTPIEQRRDAACEKLGPRMTACAVEDARKSLVSGFDPSGKAYTKAMFDSDTAEQVRAKNTSAFIDKCKQQHLNSYQIRVYEVCMREESACDALLACLQHVHDPAAGP